MDAQVNPVDEAGERSRLPESQGVVIVKMTSPREAVLLLPLVRAWHAESQYRHLPFSERKFLAQVIKALQRRDDGATFYALHRGEAIGLIDVAAGEAWLSEGGRYATCLAWFVRPDIRASLLGGRLSGRLLYQARAWAIETGAASLFLNGTHGMRSSLSRLGKIMGHNVEIGLAEAGVGGDDRGRAR
ncbi:GNAT family N-acetyltransferase [Devosia sp. LjRoot16]|uniref:hypothetical protein n=1 Tax=Devosia sp. LjRoot16 TaxID=3342271 RepID=UPI003ECFEC8E